MATSSVASNGLLSDKVREILKMPKILIDPLSGQNILDANEEDLDVQKSLLLNSNEQLTILKKILKNSENKKISLVESAAVISALKGLKPSNTDSIVKTLEKKLERLNPNYPINRLNRQLGYASPMVANRVIGGNNGSFPKTAANDSSSSMLGMASSALVGAGAGGLGASFLTAGKTALSFGSKVASKAALPLAAAVATYEGIQGAMDADNILGKDSSFLDKIQVGVTEATNGLLLGLPDMISKSITGEGFSKSINNSLSNMTEISQDKLSALTDLGSPLDSSISMLQDTLSTLNTEKSAKETGESIGQYLDEYLEKKDKSLWEWLRGQAATIWNGKTETDKNLDGSSGSSIGGGNTPSYKGGSNNSPTSSSSTNTPLQQQVSLGKGPDGKDVTIPLPLVAPTVTSDNGQFNYTEVKPSTNNIPYSGGFLDPKSNPDVNQQVLDKYKDRQLPVVIRNNNPAALSLMKPGSGEFAERQEGYLGATPRPANEGGYYAKYATPEHGIAANAKLLERYGDQGVNTPDAIVRKWSTDTNAHSAYSKRLQEALGVSGDTTIDLKDKGIQQKILMAKSAHESGAGLPIYSEDTFKRGVNREFKNNTSPIITGQVPVKMSNGATEFLDLDKSKIGQAFQGGNTHQATLEAAKAINSVMGDNVNRFTAFNDTYHAGSRSKHAVGLAGDFTLKDTSGSQGTYERLKTLFTQAGLSEKDFRVIDEYKNPSAKATGGHIHYQFNSPEAAQKFVQSLGDPKIRQSIGLKDDYNKPVDNVMSKEELYKNSPFLKSKSDTGKTGVFPEMQGLNEKTAQPQKVPTDVTNTNTGVDFAPALLPQQPNNMQPNNMQPNASQNNSPVQNYGQIMNAAPTIDNELSMLAVNSTMMS